MSVLYTYFYAMSMYIYKNRNICANRQIYNKMFKINVHIVSFYVSFPLKSIFQAYKSSEFVFKNSLLCCKYSVY